MKEGEGMLAALDGLTIFANRVYLGVGDSITLTAKRIVAGVLEPVDCDWTLQSGAADAAFDGAATATPSVTLTGLSVSPQYGNVYVQATDCTQPTEVDTASFTVTTIRLYAAIDGGNPAEITGTLYVPRGSTVTFEADLLPHFSPWPDGGPEWTGAEPGEAVGTASAVYVEASASVESPEVVTVTCGGTAAAQVVVFDLGPVRYRLNDVDDWQECDDVLALPKDLSTVQLEVAVVPAGVPASAASVGWGVEAPSQVFCASGQIIAQLQGSPGVPGRIVLSLSGDLPETTMGYPTATASCATLARSVRVGLMGIDRLEYTGFGMSEWRDIPGTGTVSVPVNTPVRVQAIPRPVDAPFPPGTPYWNDAHADAWTQGTEITLTYPVASSLDSHVSSRS